MVDAGEAVPLDSDLVYLAMGTGQALLQRGARALRLDSWSTGDEIRLGRSALRTILAQMRD